MEVAVSLLPSKWSRDHNGSFLTYFNDSPKKACLARIHFADQPGGPGRSRRALSLARATPHHLLVIDDLSGRTAAQRLGLRFIGTAGSIIRARKAGGQREAGRCVNKVSP
ncbi:MAG: hypothetical protein H0V44_11930 [Planctomycetes bacterium]|nr:hypothetical protein [Planctomycetota bacterium]